MFSLSEVHPKNIQRMSILAPRQRFRHIARDRGRQRWKVELIPHKPASHLFGWVRASCFHAGPARNRTETCWQAGTHTHKEEIGGGGGVNSKKE